MAKDIFISVNMSHGFKAARKLLKPNLVTGDIASNPDYVNFMHFAMFNKIQSVLHPIHFVLDLIFQEEALTFIFQILPLHI